jgi:hypothetical protein
MKHSLITSPWVLWLIFLGLLIIAYTVKHWRDER